MTASMNLTRLHPLELTGRAASHSQDATDLGVRLNSRVIPAVRALREAAAAAGIELEIVSAFRDFSRQAAIWNSKFRGERPVLDAAGTALDVSQLDDAGRIAAILVWSALPGASRHHWGTDFDVIDRAAVSPDYRPQLTVEEFSSGGPFVRLNEWLAANLGNHGFFRPYTTFRGGVRPEPWHLSYAPVSVPALQALSLDVLTDAIAASNLDGRQSVLAQLPGLYDRYVVSVDTP
jgi:LAS superfamily LD-carboxypeptidase LdcB